MPLQSSIFSKIDLNCSIAITSFRSGKYAVYYDPEGCITNANLESFNGFIFHPFIENKSNPKLYLQPSTTFVSNDFNTVKRFIESLVAETNVETIKEAYIPSKEDHIKLVREAISKLDDKLKKVVISRIDKSETDLDPVDMFEKFCKAYPENGNYLFYSKESGLWLGSSPEILIEIDHQNGQTCALAGTKSNSEEWTSKEKEEQQMVEDYINSSFDELNIEYSSSKSNISLKGIDHIKTSYKFLLGKDFSFTKLLNRLHPTPAVAGLPKQEAIDFIQTIEQHDRKYYTGYFGIVDPNNKKLFVNLRCLQMNSSQSYYYLGGGITKDSNPEKEYLETVRKKKSLIL